MESKKRDLEIIYNLQWKNQSANGGEKANIIGMYDIPATTLNWEVFKSYLLKNSGTALDDVKVTYVTSNDREFPIESQTDFQIALYAFRRKARMNEIITLKLDRVSKQQKKKSKRQSIDVETQFDDVDSTCNVTNMNETPPQWFTAYMCKFKDEVSYEIKEAVATSVSNIKPTVLPLQHSCSCYHTRKSKVDSKRVRKYPNLLSQLDHQQPNEKDLIKSLKLERKLENKLEKLECKTKKIKEKKLALFTKSTSDSDVGPSTSSKIRPKNVLAVYKMDAAVIKKVQDHVPRFQGGEIYTHTWNVVNTGSDEWTSETFLQYTWGSKVLHPVEASVPCPKLKPGEQGILSVQLKIPCEYGTYECYWHFHHLGRRFGQWLGCQLTVDPFHEPPSKISCCHDEEDKSSMHHLNHFAEPTAPQTDVAQAFNSLDEGARPLDDVVRSVGAMKIRDDANCSSDSDNQSVGSDDGNASKSSNDEFVVVQSQEATNTPSSCYRIDSMDLFEVEEEEVLRKAGVDNFDDNNNTESRPSSSVGRVDSEAGSRHSDLIVLSLPQADEGVEEGYAYVEVNGQGLHIPRRMIKTEYLAKGDEEPWNKTPSAVSVSSSVVVVNDEIPEAQVAQNEARPSGDLETDGCAAPSSLSGPTAGVWQFRSDKAESEEQAPRVFVFPQERPGVEVRSKIIVPETPAPISTATTRYDPYGPLEEPAAAAIYTTASACAPPTTVSSGNNPFAPPSFVANYQQTPPEQRGAPNADELLARALEEEERRLQEAAPRQSPSAPPTHTLPETLVSGAVNVASSAINTARSVINMIVPPRESGSWVNGHWVATSTDTPREANLRALAEMGFWDRDLNATLLARYNDDLTRVVADLVQ